MQLNPSDSKYSSIGCYAVFSDSKTRYASHGQKQCSLFGTFRESRHAPPNGHPTKVGITIFAERPTDRPIFLRKLRGIARLSPCFAGEVSWEVFPATLNGILCSPCTWGVPFSGPPPKWWLSCWSLLEFIEKGYPQKRQSHMNRTEKAKNTGVSSEGAFQMVGPASSE